MEFEEIKKIWDEQNKEQLFAINEAAMFRNIRNSKIVSERISTITEFLLMATFLYTGFMTFFKITGPDYWLNYGFGILMLIALIGIIISRIIRKSKKTRFDQNMLGNLEQALHTATYQVKLAQIVRWIFLPVAVFLGTMLYRLERPWWMIFTAVIILIAGFWASAWEINWYRRRREKLVKLKQQLIK